MPALPAEEYIQKLEKLDIYYVASEEDTPLIDEALRLIAKADPRFIGLDTETTGLNAEKHRVRTLQLASEDVALVIDLDAFRARGEDGSIQRPVPWDKNQGLRLVKYYIERTSKTLVIHGSDFDINFLRFEGIKFANQSIFDTLISSRIINNGTAHSNSLDAVCKRRLGVSLDKTLQKSKFDAELTVEQVRYGAIDAAVLPMLAPVMRDLLLSNALTDDKTLYSVFELEMSCVLAISSMQYNGFQFDLYKAKQLKAELEKEADQAKLAFCEALDARLRKRKKPGLPRDEDGNLNLRAKASGSIRLGTKKPAGFNPRSTKQMIEAFVEASIKLPIINKDKYSLDQNLLSFLRYNIPLINQYLEWKHQVTRVSAVAKLIKHTTDQLRIHASYNQTGTRTGRLSCSDPNLQQVPKEATFRQLFIASDGFSLIFADFSQIELRVAAHLSQEERMIDAYINGRDLHRETAALMTNKPYDLVTDAERRSAKICNFGLIYGAGAATLRKQAMSQYGVLYSMDEAKELVKGFRSSYPRLFEWQAEVGNATTASVYTISGRRRIVRGSFDDKYTTRVNTEVQGTAGDIAKRAVAYLWESLLARADEDPRLIAMVHDEIGLEARVEHADFWAHTLKDCMERAGSFYIPDVPIIAEVGVGKTWSAVK